MRGTMGRVLAALCLAIAVLCLPAIAQKIPTETWMGVYLGQTRIGYSKFAIDKSEYQGKPSYRLESSSSTRISALGVEVEQTLDTVVYLDSNFNPLRQVFRMSSGGHSMGINADFGPEEIVAEAISEGTRSTKNIPIPKGAKLVSDTTYLPIGTQLKVGDKVSYMWFNPVTMTLDNLELEVLRKEELKLGSEVFQAFVIKSTSSAGEMMCWQDENGELLKVQAVAGILMIRESKEEAMAGATSTYSPPADLAVMTSAATDTRIPNPRKVKSMRVLLSGITEDSLVLQDDRQKIERRSEEGVIEYSIKASELNTSKTLLLPLPKVGMSDYLADTAYIQPSNSEISRTAQKIIGDEKNTGKIVSKIRAWVNKNMRPRGDIGILRTSVDILHAKSGVCRDYAVLYTALARSVGIPTRLISGLVYWKGGFYYHAWAESYVGQWVPVDATLDTDFVDATHIKLAQGDVNVMFQTVKTMGAIKADIIEWK